MEINSINDRYKYKLRYNLIKRKKFSDNQLKAKQDRLLNEDLLMKNHLKRVSTVSKKISEVKKDHLRKNVNSLGYIKKIYKDEIYFCNSDSPRKYFGANSRQSILNSVTPRPNLKLKLPEISNHTILLNNLGPISRRSSDDFYLKNLPVSNKSPLEKECFEDIINQETQTENFNNSFGHKNPNVLKKFPLKLKNFLDIVETSHVLNQEDQSYNFIKRKVKKSKKPNFWVN
jgi:hypothetical protein